jgi:general secretion pathway protein D
MKKLHRTQLAWAALALALVAGSLVAQEGDPQSRKRQFLVEALKARDEGNLQAAQEKFEQIIQIDADDQGAKEGLASVKASKAAADAAKKAADEAAAKPPGNLDEVAGAHEKLFEEVTQAIAAAKKQAADGQYKGAIDRLDGAAGAIAGLPNTPASQKLRDGIAIAKQEINIQRESGDKDGGSVANEEVRRLAKASAASLRKSEDALSAAESLIRKGEADSLDKAVLEIDRVTLELGADSLVNKDLKARAKEAMGSAIARRALIAIEARDIPKAESLIRDFEKLKGAEDPSVVRLKKEFATKRANPTYRGVDEISPGLRAKDEKVNDLLVKGRARYLYGDYQGALDSYREVLQYQPNNSESKAYQVRIRQMLSENSGQWNRGVTKGKLLELLDETWKLPEVFNRENTKQDLGNSADPIIDKMKSILIPDPGFVVRDQPLERALQSLVQASQNYDKDQKGVNIVLLDPANKNPSVSIQLKGVSVYQCLEYVCKRVGFSFTVSSGGIIEVREDSGDSLLETEIYPLSTAAVLKMTGFGAGGAAPAGGAASGAAASPFGGAAGSAAGAGDGQRPDEAAIKNFLTRSGVAFDAPATLSYDGTNLIVYQSRKNLDRVKNIIRRYSDIKQVHIEAKFIEVEQKMLNELGVNWNLSPTGSPLSNSNTFSAAGANTNLRSVSDVFKNNDGSGKSLTITSGTPLTDPAPIADTAPNFPGGINYGPSNGSYAGKVGVMGFCSGGRQAFLCAGRSSSFDAAIDCWGGRVMVKDASALTDKQPVAPIDYAKDITCPVLGLFGNDDKEPAPDQVDKTEEILKSLGKDFEFHRYDGAGHAFFDWSRPSYRPEQAMDGWKKIFAFLGKHLA